MAAGTPVAFARNFAEFRETWARTIAPGTSFLHAQLYPRHHPTDALAMERLEAKGKPLSALIGPEYRNWIKRVRSCGATIGRLLVVHGPGEERYDPGYFDQMQTIFEPVRALGEEVLYTHYRQQIEALNHYCGAGSPLVAAYQEGVGNSSPKASFWSIRSIGQAAVQTVWFINYQGDTLAGGPVYQHPMPAAVERYEAFWHGVYNDPQQSYPLD